MSNTVPGSDALIPLTVGRLRLAVGLLQGLLLYALYRAATDHAWPATVPVLFVALVLAGVLAPVLLVSSLGHLPRRAVAGWIVAAGVLAAGLGGYDAWCDVIEVKQTTAPSMPLCLAAISGFFIAQ